MFIGNYLEDTLYRFQWPKQFLPRHDIFVVCVTFELDLGWRFGAEVQGKGSCLYPAPRFHSMIHNYNPLNESSK